MPFHLLDQSTLRKHLTGSNALKLENKKVQRLQGLEETSFRGGSELNGEFILRLSVLRSVKVTFK